MPLRRPSRPISPGVTPSAYRHQQYDAIEAPIWAHSVRVEWHALHTGDAGAIGYTHAVARTRREQQRRLQALSLSRSRARQRSVSRSLVKNVERVVSMHVEYRAGMRVLFVRRNERLNGS